MKSDVDQPVVTVTLNPALDQTVSCFRFHAGRVNRAEGIEMHAGGKGINVASCLADYGLSVTATGLLGAENDELFVAHMRQRGIEDRFLRIPGRTRMGLKLVDHATCETTDINFPGLSPAPEDLERLEATLDELMEEGRWIILSGSLPPGVECGWYASLIRRIKQRGGRVALDTSGEPLRRAIDAGPDLVKPNLYELREWCQSPLTSHVEVLRAARTLVDKGILTVAVSMGAEGAIFVEGSEAVRARPPAVKVKSTVAAGDAMVAGLLAGARAGLDLAARARLSTAFALEVLVQTGAGIDLDHVEERQREVCIESIRMRQ